MSTTSSYGHCMKHLIFSISICFTLFTASPSLFAQNTVLVSSDNLNLQLVGDDCTSSIEVLNQRLTKQKLRSYQNDLSIFSFITDVCETNLIKVGIFGETHKLTRPDTRNQLGQGGIYSDDALSVEVKRGPLRSKIIFPPPAACEDGHLEHMEYFDATTTVKTKANVYRIQSTLISPGCTRAYVTKSGKIVTPQSKQRRGN